ncbi:hypothetical protein ACJMK2_012948, partial [Sinanodonta woodiana]
YLFIVPGVMTLSALCVLACILRRSKKKKRIWPKSRSDGESCHDTLSSPAPPYSRNN